MIKVFIVCIGINFLIPNLLSQNQESYQLLNIKNKQKLLNIKIIREEVNRYFKGTEFLGKKIQQSYKFASEYGNYNIGAKKMSTSQGGSQGFGLGVDTGSTETNVPILMGNKGNRGTSPKTSNQTESSQQLSPQEQKEFKELLKQFMQ